MSTPVLASRGFLIIGPTQQLFVSKAEHLEAEKLELIDQENIARPNGPLVEEVDLLIHELFSKDYCGAVDFSAEAVANLGTWDEDFAKLQVRKNRRILNFTLDPIDPNPSATVDKLIDVHKQAVAAAG